MILIRDTSPSLRFVTGALMRKEDRKILLQKETLPAVAK
jgi:hypothetical protein